MSKHPVLTAIVITAFATAGASAQRSGGGVVGGVIGGVGGAVRGVGGAVGGAVGGVGGTVSSIGGTVGSVGGSVGGGVGGAISGIGGGIGSIGGSVQRGAGGALGNINGFNSVTGSSEGALLNAVNPAMILEDVYQPQISQSEPEMLAQIRRMRHEFLIRANKTTLDRDPAGEPVRKSELIVVDPDAASLTAALGAGFRITQDERQPQLGLRVLTLACPKGVNVREALKLLRRAAPAIHADFNHVLEPAGGALLPAASVKLATRSNLLPGTRIAMIDGGVASHPSMARANIEQRGFAGQPQPTGHGTAVGSLLVGTQGPFQGAARGAQLFVGDVYGGNPAAGSVTVIVRALAWAASKRPAVINISLVGPENQTLARAISALQARGIKIVAAVGNDGPAAPVQYPASYPGVIAVTGVDGQDRALREAGRSIHLDFAAPGADLVAALPGDGFTPVRGTSFAAPFVAARLAATGSPVVLAAEAVPGKGKVGRGIVCRTCRIQPKLVGLR